MLLPLLVMALAFTVLFFYPLAESASAPPILGAPHRRRCVSAGRSRGVDPAQSG